MKKISITVLISFLVLFLQSGSPLHARAIVRLTLDSAVDIAMKNSYRIKMLEMAIQRNYSWLKAERAALKSKLYMNMTTPEFNEVADYKWNSTLRMYEIIRQNTRRWQIDLSLRQPVIVLGYPTNGYLSLNNKTYRYLQKYDDGDDVDYYNRFFVKYEQPFFRPNRLKNDIENAELNLKREELQSIIDKVSVIDHISFDFFDLYKLIQRNEILFRQVEDLERIRDIARAVSQNDTTREIENVRIQIELMNAHEMLMGNQSDLRLRLMNMKQRLRLGIQDSLLVEHDIQITPVEVDSEQAFRYGFNLQPRLRIMSINNRKTEIDISNVKGRDSFFINLGITFGLEKYEDRYQGMWEEYDNSYSVSLNAYVPIWDWGRRKANIEAAKISLKRSKLYTEETKDSIKNNINNSITNLEDYQRRALNLKESLKTVRGNCDLSIVQFEEGRISFQGIMQIIERKKEAEINFIESYIGYRISLLSLMLQTHYDYENEISLVEQYRLGS